MKYLHVFYYDGTDICLRHIRSIYSPIRANAIVFIDLYLPPDKQEGLKKELIGDWSRIRPIPILLEHKDVFSVIDFWIQSSFEDYYPGSTDPDFECDYYLDTAPSLFTYYMLRLAKKYNVVLFSEPYLNSLLPIASTTYDEFQILILNIAYYQDKYNGGCFSIKNMVVDLFDIKEKGHARIKDFTSSNKMSTKVKNCIDQFVKEGYMEPISSEEFDVIRGRIGKTIVSIKSSVDGDTYDDKRLLAKLSSFSEFMVDPYRPSKKVSPKLSNYKNRACGGHHLYRLTAAGKIVCESEDILMNCSNLYLNGRPPSSIRIFDQDSSLKL